MLFRMPHARFLQLCLGFFIATLCSQSHAEDVTPARNKNPFRAISQLIFGRSTSAEPAVPNIPSTHRQTGTIQVVPTPDPEGRSLVSFCLLSDGLILAAVEGPSSELRALHPDGSLVRSILVPIRPEAVNVGPEQTILVAGEGQVLVLDAAGEILRQAHAPHVSKIRDNRDAIRKEVESQMRESATMMSAQVQAFEKQAKQLVVQKLSAEEADELRVLQAQVERSNAVPESQRSPRERRAMDHRRQLVESLEESAEWKLNDAEREQLAALKDQAKMFADYVAQNGGDQITEEKLEEMVEATIKSKCAVASISTDGAAIYLATGAERGYGFDVWRVGLDLEGGERVLKGLRGCCGQMDVQAREDGIYVAENARHRVSHYDRDGNSVKHWGKASPEDVAEFGDCCNPMNVAFGADGSVYTAESNSGRIKKYSVDGELQALIGNVDLVPGCKKVSIAVSQDGAQVYMLDVTRGHILVMQANPKDQQPAAVEGSVPSNVEVVVDNDATK
jgi:sugar lactone lactonase YvrE